LFDTEATKSLAIVVQLLYQH